MSRRPILLVGGAPRVAVDAVRHLVVTATGRTAFALAELVRARGHSRVELLLGQDALAGEAMRFREREDLERLLKAWILATPDGVVVMSAAVNDYQVARVESVRKGEAVRLDQSRKIASGADEVRIILEPAPKLIDALVKWGHTGPVIGFKYQEKSTVIAAAQALRERVGAAVVFANSICGSVNALVDAHQVAPFGEDRTAALSALSDRLVDL